MFITNITNKVRAFVKEQAHNRAVGIVSGSSVGFIVLNGMCCAEGNVINVTQITGMLTDIGAIFPALGNLVVQIMPTLLILGIIGFVLKFFNQIIALISKVF